MKIFNFLPQVRLREAENEETIKNLRQKLLENEEVLVINIILLRLHSETLPGPEEGERGYSREQHRQSAGGAGGQQAQGGGE